jgi:eukaryotic-like serine/threonine-protein kinase
MNQYKLFDSIASGGMGTVHYGRAAAGSGLSRVVAVKRMHGDLARDPGCLAMFRDELRLATRVRHPNVVGTLDMVEQDGELLLVMEYVQGESLQDLISRASIAGEHVPPAIAVSIVCGILQGLEAAHDAKNEAGEPLGIVHRDVSPENILVGRDGIARLLDFGIARGKGSKHVTRVGEIKGKPSYLAPEQILHSQPIDRRVDIYGASIVLWETLTSRRLFDGDSPTVILSRVLNDEVPRPSSLVGSLPEGLDEVVMRGLSRDPNDRYATALEMARALRRVCGSLLSFEVGEWVEATAADSLARQSQYVTRLENSDTARQTPVAISAALREELFGDAEEAAPESTRTTMALTPRSSAPRRGVVDRLGRWLERGPRLKQGLFAVALAGFCFMSGVVAVNAAMARPYTAPVAAAAAAIQPPKPAALVPPTPVAPTVSVTTLAPLPSASSKPKKKHAPALAAAPRRPIIDDGF